MRRRSRRQRRWPPLPPSRLVTAAAARSTSAISFACWRRERYRLLRAARVARPARRRADMSTHNITIKVNGQPHSADVESRLLLVHFIRESLRLTGTHIGCDTTHCGACTVLVDGVPVKSCTVLAVQADGREVMTVEGLEKGGQLDPIQDGFMRSEEH